MGSEGRHGGARRKPAVRSCQAPRRTPGAVAREHKWVCGALGFFYLWRSADGTLFWLGIPGCSCGGSRARRSRHDHAGWLEQEKNHKGRCILSGRDQQREEVSQAERCGADATFLFTLDLCLLYKRSRSSGNEGRRKFPALAAPHAIDGAGAARSSGGTRLARKGDNEAGGSRPGYIG